MSLILLHIHALHNKFVVSQLSLSLFFFSVQKNRHIGSELKILPLTKPSTSKEAAMPGATTGSTLLTGSTSGPTLQEYLLAKSETQLRNYMVRMEGGVARLYHHQSF